MACCTTEVTLAASCSEVEVRPVGARWRLPSRMRPSASTMPGLDLGAAEVDGERECGHDAGPAGIVISTIQVPSQNTPIMMTTAPSGHQNVHRRG